QFSGPPPEHQTIRNVQGQFVSPQMLTTPNIIQSIQTEAPKARSALKIVTDQAEALHKVFVSKVKFEGFDPQNLKLVQKELTKISDFDPNLFLGSVKKIVAATEKDIPGALGTFDRVSQTIKLNMDRIGKSDYGKVI